ncbi:MAG: glycosyltransferase family 2 protein [Polyangiaceae bacterium]|nr:glycosyltransferase family 2 protein [Polyangiaceae bacterium]MCW5792481.1 glycosyltransferase family 2 protein [Polyangiaceae bacterium]
MELGQIVFVIPAYQAAASVGGVVRELLRVAPGARVLVVDDGSTDRTSEVARAAGAEVLRHAVNLGKGAALTMGLTAAAQRGARAAVSLDADGQHLPHEAARLAAHPAPPGALVITVRDLARAQAPGNARFSNALSNWFLSRAVGFELEDTQCGLRRYPLPECLGLGVRARGFEFESEILMRAAWMGLPIVQLPVEVYYPPPPLRVSHFHVVKDPARIIRRFLITWAETRRPRRERS